jgi:hypothetical protein
MLAEENFTAKETEATRMLRFGKYPPVWKSPWVPVGGGGALAIHPKKSALWISPRISQSALFPEPIRITCSVDFPPEIKIEAYWHCYLAVSSSSPKRLRTPSNYLKIRVLKVFRGPESGQLVPFPAIPTR